MDSGLEWDPCVDGARGHGEQLSEEKDHRQLAAAHQD